MKIKLVDELNAELKNMYHNATPNYPTLESDYEQDLFDSWFQDIASMAIDDLKYDEIFGALVKDYGPIYTYGRGGRTVAPSKLIIGKGGSSFRTATVNDLDIEPLEARSLLRLLREFNRSVKAWNKCLPEQWDDHVEANELQNDINANKSKSRKQVTVYR